MFVAGGGWFLVETGFQITTGRPRWPGLVIELGFTVVIVWWSPGIRTGPATWLPSSFFGNQTESKITKIAFLSKMVTLQSGLLSIFLLIANSLGAPQQRQDVSRSQDPLNCNDLDVYGFHCVPIFQCSNEGIIKTDARGLFDPRYVK